MGDKFNDKKSLSHVGAQCLRPPEGASIAPLQIHLDRATFHRVRVDRDGDRPLAYSSIFNSATTRSTSATVQA